VQEEFDRYTGYWWSPAPLPNKDDDVTDHAPVYCILYEEVDEGEVEILNIFSPSVEGKNVDQYRYPRAGKRDQSHYPRAGRRDQYRYHRAGKRDQ
jgi:dipeptidyl-peptidase 9